MNRKIKKKGGMMRHRRPRRPFGRRPGMRRRPHPHKQGGTLNPRLQRELKRANHLMSKGEHENAAQVFLSLAERAQDRGVLQPASMLFLQAAHAYLLGGRVQDSIEQATNGLKMIAADIRWRALELEGGRFVATLESNGYQKQADEMKVWLNERINGHIEDTPAKDKNNVALQLPEKCPYCGASMSLEQISGRGAKAAECRYCSSIVVPT